MYAPVEDYDGEGLVAAHYAARDGNTTRLVAALRSDPSLIDVQGIFDGATPLMCAARSARSFAVLEWLIAKDANLEVTDFENMTALCHAVVNANAAAVEKLINARANISATMASKRWLAGTTPFMAALVCAADASADRAPSFLSIAERLYQAGADANAKDVSGRQALTYVAIKGNVVVLKDALQRFGLMPESDVANVDPHAVIRYLRTGERDVMEIGAAMTKSAMDFTGKQILASRETESQELDVVESDSSSRFGL